MKKIYGYRHTDLALELQEEFDQAVRQEGFLIETNALCGDKIRETVIKIQSEEAEKRFGKPKGTYITLEGEELAGNNDLFHENMSMRLAHHLKELMGDKEQILVAGLGNGEVTPDALGPLVIKNLFVTRHLASFKEFADMRKSTTIAPGVMAQTGMETGEILKGIIREVKPDIMLVIDALAAKNFERLNCTIQISDTGIAPGSGVGNRRKEISERTMGIPVIALGVPTVISIPAIASDILDCFAHSAEGNKMVDYLIKSEQERYEYLADILEERLFGFFVTPKEIDESVKRISYTISEGINQFVAKKRYKFPGQA